MSLFDFIWFFLLNFWLAFNSYELLKGIINLQVQQQDIYIYISGKLIHNEGDQTMQQVVQNDLGNLHPGKECLTDSEQPDIT